MEPQTILDVAGAVPQEVVHGLLKACKSNNFTEIQQAITDAIADGYPVSAAPCACGCQHTCYSVIMCVARKNIACKATTDIMNMELSSRRWSCLASHGVV